MERLHLRPVAVGRQLGHAAERRRVEQVADAHDAVRGAGLQLAGDAAAQPPLLEGHGAPPLSPRVVEGQHIASAPVDDHSAVGPVHHVGRLPVQLRDDAHAALFEAVVTVQGLLLAAGADDWRPASFGSRDELLRVRKGHEGTPLRGVLLARCAVDASGVQGRLAIL